jgi:HB1/ASXL restriction endonuclease-like protein with HTH domain
MFKTKTTKAKTSKATKRALEIRKDGKGRFWVVPKDGGAEHGPFATKKEAADAKAAIASRALAPTPTSNASEKGKTAAKAKKAKEPKEKKLSAIDAAAQVLAASKEPMNAKEIIEAMTTKALWTSPGGKTPHATLYSAIIRDISTKGKDARFV